MNQTLGREMPPGLLGAFAPLLDIVLRQRDVERRAARAAGRVDARRPGDRDGRVAAERRMGGLASPQLVLLGKGQSSDRLQPADPLARNEARGRQLFAVK